MEKSSGLNSILINVVDMDASTKRSDLKSPAEAIPRQVTASTMASNQEIHASGADKSKCLRECWRNAPALFKAMTQGTAGIFLQFGGQGLQGSHYLDELRYLYHANSDVRSLVESCAERLQKEVSSPNLQRYGLHQTFGLDVVEWISNDASRPPTAYLLNASVSYALIGLTQLSRYAYMVITSGLRFDDFAANVKGATGHSQGVMAAVVAGTSGSKEAFEENTKNMVAYLLWHGSRVQILVNQVLPLVPIKTGEGARCMLSVSGIRYEVLSDLVEHKMNKLQMAISLENGCGRFVVSGSPEALEELRAALMKMSAGSESQDRIPFSKRKPVITTNWVEATVPFHHYMLHPASAALAKDAQRLHYTIPSSSFLFPVYGNNREAEDFSALDVPDVLPRLVRMQVNEPMVWASALRCANADSGVTHVLDLGPGGASGAGVLTKRLVKGTGVSVINVSDQEEFAQLMHERKSVVYGSSWAQQYGPRIVACEGKHMVSTRWTTIVGKPPVMIAGMTPTTSTYGLDLVAAASNQGFQCELAAGGFSRPEIFKERIEKLCAKLNPGIGVVINMLYLNARQFGFQLPLAVKMRQDGAPIESITIGAGVPSVEKANEIIQQLKQVGMRYMSFKPGSLSAIHNALEIAAANPDFYIVLQWTGGRGGGHHSFEDMHDPIVQAYPHIRALANTLLVAGSGFGDAKGSLPYLTGEWSAALGHPPMPFDCVLLASRMMVCEEAATATSVKEILVKTPGIVNEAKWDTSYEGVAGGIITVKSELGEPIHKVATRGVRLWREFDKQFFSVPVKDRQIVKKKDYIIQRINDDYQKVYFGRKASGEVCDVLEMTYAEVLVRFVELCYIRPEDEVESRHHEDWTPQGRWIDISYQTRLETWIHQCETRVNAGNEPFLRGTDFSCPMETVRAFITRFPVLEDALLTTEDADVFIHLCKTGGKPVPFIPIIDNDFEVWFKKDSLWYSEDLAAVPGHDADRVCILQGPVSVAHSTKVNEPVGRVLENICHEWVATLPDAFIQVDEIEDPNIDFSVFPEVCVVGDTITICLPQDGDLPEEEPWRKFLGGKEESWMKALLTSSTIVRNKKWVSNTLGKLFKPRASQKVEIFRSPDPTLSTLRIFEPETCAHAVLDARMVDTVVTVTIHDVRPATLEAPQEVVPLRLRATYHPHQVTQIHELDPVDEVKQYYQKLWFTGETQVLDLRATQEATFSISQRDVDEFNAAIFASPSDRKSTTVDFCIVAAWKPLISCLFPEAIRGNILDLVHLSNAYDHFGTSSTDRQALRVGDKIHSAVRVVEIANTPGGKMVKCSGTLAREGENPMVRLTSSFLFRGTFTDSQNCFKRQDRVASIELNETLLAVLRSKEWFHPAEGENIFDGDRLEFTVSFEDTYSETTKHAVAHGVVFRASTKVGTVHWESEGENVVAGFLDRWEALEQPTIFADGGYRVLKEVDIVTTPSSSIAYAIASRDLNPIHRNAYVAEMAGLQPIVHGMWMSANARRVVEYVGGSRSSIKSYSCDFERMAYAGEKLYSHVTHVGNKNGRKLVTVHTCNAAGEIVLKGRAEIDFPITAYVFTGQGSQEQGMGMDLYARSPHVKAIWDEAEAHLLHMYGFSILDIVRNNPKSVTVRFGGRKGAAIRRNYMKLMKVRPDGTTEPLMSSISLKSTSYEFSFPAGLLFATQFTQPVLTLMEVAIYEDLRVNGLVPPGHMLAGHSLGEYAALAATARVFTITKLVEVAFLRGMTMQSAVPRDAEGRSEFGMIAVNPTRVGAHVTEQLLQDAVDQIERKTELLVQIVNYNVAGMQYIVAGKVQGLTILDAVMNALCDTKTSVIDDIVDKAITAVKERMRGLDGVLTLERGKATIPLAGLDVPFHSKFLLPGVDSFRRTLEEHILACDPDMLVSRFLPNLTASPFSLSRKYVMEVFEVTQSRKLAAVLEDWTTFEADRWALSKTLMIELLAFQFACPVRWIQTQDYFFTTARVKRIIEIGPTPILKGMALRTLSTGAYGLPSSRSVLHCSQDRDETYCNISDMGPTCEDAAKAEMIPEEKEEAVLETPELQALPALAPVVVSVAPPARAVADSPVTALESLQVFLALTLQKTVSDIPESCTIKELCGGKSALQNEIMADLAKEFGEGPENAIDLTLVDLAKGYSTYNTLGKYGVECIAKMMSSKMPGGFNLQNAKQYLTDEFQLGPGRTESVLLHTVLVRPKSRLGSMREAHAWLDTVVESYAKKSNISITKGAASSDMLASLASMMGGAAPTPIADSPVSATEFIKVILALKLKLPLSSIPEGKSLKDLTGGKSALQNEILGDLGAELGDPSDGAVELPLGELAKNFPNYSALGKTSSTLLEKLVSAKMAGSFGMSAVKTYLAEQWLLPPGRVNSVLLHALTMEPDYRLDDAGSKKWLASVVASFGALYNLVIPQATAMSGVLPQANISSKALNALEKRFKELVEATVDSQLSFLNVDKYRAVRDCETEILLRTNVEKELEEWIAEHGEFYRVGIKPMFRAAMQRTYDSFWNWSRMEVLRVYNAWLADGRDEKISSERIARLVNRGSQDLLDMINALSSAASDPSLKHFLESLASDVAQKVGKPACRPDFESLAPRTIVTKDGRIVYEEILRPGVGCIREYIAEMKRGFEYVEVAATTRKSHQRQSESVPYIYLETSNPKQPTRRMVDDEASEDYFQALLDLAERGISLDGKVVVVTGCGVDSIGIELVKYLLQAGAHVVATTSTFTLSRTQFYRSVYEENCGASSILTIVPFNQASTQDVASFVSHLYDSMGVDVDFVVPFAAISENGSDISNIEGKNELSHRVMLTNTIRLLGAIKAKKEERQILTKPATALLPLSPNHGIFGNDGLYSESKLGLEALLAKSVTEGWSDYMSIVGVVIGWTRGTGLMSGNNFVAESLEVQGLRTFSQREMAFNLMALFHPSLVTLSHECPVVANVGGGISMVSDLKNLSMTTRADLFARAELKRRVKTDILADEKLVRGLASAAVVKQATNFKSHFPPLPTRERVQQLSKLQHMVDLEKVVVCVGYGEVGPWGSARTRWEMESYGAFSLEGCVELAWILGYIRYHNGPLAGKDHHIGWVDAVSNEPVSDLDVKARYEETMLGLCGVRIVDQTICPGYNPHHKQYFHQVALERDLLPIEVSSEQEAQELRKRVGANLCDIFLRKEDGVWCVQFKRGGTVILPRALQFDRYHAAQIPSGWSAARLGIPQDIVNTVDRVVLYTLVSTVEALITAGITDPYEFYKYVHVTAVGNASGGGMGGSNSLRSVFQKRYINLENDAVRGDVLQEAFINTASAWVNMLLLSSSGPIKTPVGACATAAESVEIGVETIVRGQASVVIVGGCDDFCEESAYEFAAMHATSSSKVEQEMGRDPREMSRPCASTRGGFMESHGAGNQILMSAGLALKMGVPIYAIVAHTATATDKEGRSVPAPGQGILTTARETKSDIPSPLLSLAYRRRRLMEEFANIDATKEHEISFIQAEAMKVDEDTRSDFITSRLELIERQSIHQRRCAQNLWGNAFFQDEPSIAPLRGSLAVWDLTIDDVAMTSFHGTGTKLNDKNESEVTHCQMEHLGRKNGNPLYVVAQKSLTGHPKGPAAAWMFNGCIQAMHSGIIPGNRNLDNVAGELKQYSHLVYPNKSVQLATKMKACMLKSFGFGQVNAEIVLVHPDFLFGACGEQEFAPYVERRAQREKDVFRYMQNSFAGKHNFVQVKNSPPYSAEMAKQVYLDPTLRASYDTNVRTYTFAHAKLDKTRRRTTKRDEPDQPLTTSTLPTVDIPVAKKLQVAMTGAAEGLRQKKDKGIGLDVEAIATFTDKSEDFLNRNFTASELEYCSKSANSAASMAARWAAKEATVKAISSSSPDSQKLWKSSGSPLKDIEVVMSASGAPTIQLHNHARDIAHVLGISEVKISISHAADVAVCQAVAE